jgi:NADPH-dependent F420 reductase
MTIGMLGGTGREGSGLALRLSLAGFPILIGSRSSERAREKAEELRHRLGQASDPTVFTGKENAEVARAADLIFLTAPFEHAAELLQACRPAFQTGSILVDVTVPLTFQAGRVQAMEFVEGSGSQHLANYLPEGITLVAAFKTIPAQLLADLNTRLDCDVFVCGDSQQAKGRVLEVASRIVGLRPVDAGPLREAHTLERMCALAIGLNRRYKVKTARFRVVGL